MMFSARQACEAKMPMEAGSTRVSRPKSLLSSMILSMDGGCVHMHSKVETQQQTKQTRSTGYVSPINTLAIKVSRLCLCHLFCQRSPSFDHSAWLSTAQCVWKVSWVQMPNKL